MDEPKANESVRKFLAAAGAIGGKAHSRRKRARPQHAQDARAADEPVANEEARHFLAAIGTKGGKVLSDKKKAHLINVAAKGGKTVTPKKLAQIRKMVAERVAKQRAAREAKARS